MADMDTQQELAEILELTHKMIEYAKSQEWDDLASAELHRRGSITQFFSRQIEESDYPYVSDAINKIMQLDESIMAMGQQGRDDIGCELTAMLKKHQVSNAYQQKSR